MQMVFGDGHKFLHNFTGCSDVIGHELTHAVTEHTSPLDYQGQSGALNEHCSDVFGIMVKQMIENETAEQADWLIGEGCLLPDVKGVALRSMKAPGTAYNDPRFVSVQCASLLFPSLGSFYYYTLFIISLSHVFFALINHARANINGIF
jgi:Zn-dependent metalloprotease